MNNPVNLIDPSGYMGDRTDSRNSGGRNWMFDLSDFVLDITPAYAEVMVAFGRPEIFTTGQLNLWEGTSLAQINNKVKIAKKILFPVTMFQAAMDAGITPDQMVSAWRESPETINWLIENPDKRADAFVGVATDYYAVIGNTLTETTLVAPAAYYLTGGKVDVHVTGQDVREHLVEPVSDKLSNWLYYLNLY